MERFEIVHVRDDQCNKVGLYEIEAFLDTNSDFKLMYQTRLITSIANALGLSNDKYREMCFNNNGIEYETELHIVFKNIEDAERVLEELQPYILMRKLKER